MKYVLHAEDCLELIGSCCDKCDCDGPKKYEALMTAARDLVRGGHAMGALQQAVEAIEGKKGKED